LSAQSGDRTRLVTPRFAIVTAAALAYFAGTGMLLSTLPRYVEDELGGSGVAVGIVIGVFSLTAAALRPWAGIIGDQRGRRVLMVGGSIILGASIGAYALVDTLLPLILLRVVSGVGEAAVFVGAATAIQDMAPESRRGEAASYFSVAVYGGLAGGPPVGEWLLRSSGFDDVWVWAALVTLFGAVLGWWTPVGTLHPPAPGKRRLLHPAGLGPGSVLGLSLTGFAAFSGFLALYVDELGLGDAGPLFALYGVLILCIRVLGARIPDRFGPARTAQLAIACIGAGTLLMAVLRSMPGLVVGTIVFSIGMSLQMPAMTALVMEAAPPHERSQAMATFSVFFDLSQGVGLLLLGGVVALLDEGAAFATATLFAAAAFMLMRRRREAGGGRSPAAEAAPTPL
jgi:MFS family permease